MPEFCHLFILEQFDWPRNGACLPEQEKEFAHYDYCVRTPPLLNTNSHHKKITNLL